MEPSHPAGWLPDPLGRYEYRYWNGTAWTDQVSTRGSHEADPLGLAPGEGPAPITPVGAAPQPVGRPQWSTQIRVVVFGGAALLVIGALLPWVKAEAGFFSVSKNGMDGDGVFTLLFGGAIALVFALTRKPNTAAWLVIALSGLAGAIAVYDTIDVSNKADELTNSSSSIHVSASVGIGLWLTLAAAILALVGGFMALTNTPESTPPGAVDQMS